ncbi:GNAT family N-acetyltransferase [Arthrobacter sp. JSM 101049]|uniref:GNAT family N-acetyltransferase n=1 Tax=Arthrobacter sp. JSM 101049 TaxID=929097 RepID=UPI0035625682
MTPAAPPETTYTFDVSGLVPADLPGGFFVGWPSPPSPEKHLQVLRGSYRALVALEAGRVVGFITAISDGVATAFIPWLEVLPEAQGRGIGSVLVRRMQDELADLYSIDLVCDDGVAPFYDQLGWHRAQAMIQRNPGYL